MVGIPLSKIGIIPHRQATEDHYTTTPSRWKVYLPNPTTTFTLPALAEGFGSTPSAVHAEAISVEGDFSPATMLDASASRPLTRINEFLKAWSR